MKKDINGLVELKNEKGETQKVFPVDAAEIIVQGDWELAEKEEPKKEEPKKGWMRNKDEDKE
jgi:hypothetical protein